MQEFNQTLAGCNPPMKNAQFRPFWLVWAVRRAILAPRSPENPYFQGYVHCLPHSVNNINFQGLGLTGGVCREGQTMGFFTE